MGSQPKDPDRLLGLIGAYAHSLRRTSQRMVNRMADERWAQPQDSLSAASDPGADVAAARTPELDPAELKPTEPDDELLSERRYEPL